MFHPFLPGRREKVDRCAPRRLIALAVAGLLSRGTAQADAILVQWGTDSANGYTTTSAGLFGSTAFEQPAGEYGLGDPGINDGRRLRSFDLNGTPLSTAGSSSTWYVGFESLREDATTSIASRNYGPSTEYRTQTTGVTESYWLQMWKKSDFANLGSGGPVTFGKDSVLTWDLRPERSLNRWVVLGGGTYYISQTTGNITSNPNLENWAVYTPSNDVRGFQPDLTPAGFVPRTFTDIQAVGFLSYSWVNSSFQLPSSQRLYFRTNNVMITAIPEPGTLALVAVALGCLRMLRQRR